ncbi:MAG: hypothetical protein J6C19_13365 [Lachnospiraceae bacterium]|nr:hypothetical protein [Lachnospiraceae bacterium]MBO5146498.1 hypothetical protein [Lachnospiraceae bacterium]
MEDNDYVLAFDHFYTTNHIQILKSLLPFMDNDSFSMLPALIKYMELEYTLSLINKGRSGFSGGIRASSTSDSKLGSNPAENMENIYKAIHKYLAPNEEKSFSQILSAFKTMKNVREMQQMMELFQSMNPDMDPGAMMENFASGNGGINGMDISEIMNMFGGTANGSKK